jgi:hypothetical protein
MYDHLKMAERNGCLKGSRLKDKAHFETTSRKKNYIKDNIIIKFCSFLLSRNEYCCWNHQIGFAFNLKGTISKKNIFRDNEQNNHRKTMSSLLAALPTLSPHFDPPLPIPRCYS